MARTYTLKRRADQQAQTRRRIVEAAIALHQNLGPAQTSFSMIAERAGVQRNTLYAHFPDERSLGLACSGLYFEQEPPPDPRSWADSADPLTAALVAIYGWYTRTAPMLAQVLRDAERHAVTREIVELRMRPVLTAWRGALAPGLTPTALPLLSLALSFQTCRTLVEEAGLPPEGAATLMAKATKAAGE